MKYLLIAALLLAFGAFGKLIGSGVGPAEDERRAKWQGKRKHEMRRRRITRKPTKGESIFGGIVCFAMGCFGLFALPSGFDPVFAGFKAIWCLLAFGMGVYNFLIAAGKVKMGGYEITDDEPDDRRAAPRSDAEARLTELRSLYDRGLITEEEYEAKRCDILSDL